MCGEGVRRKRERREGRRRGIGRKEKRKRRGEKNRKGKEEGGVKKKRRKRRGEREGRRGRGEGGEIVRKE